jgi:hypothetical protein
VNGEMIGSEYISKMVNNYTIFKTFIRENKIKDENTFYSLLESKFDDVYHYSGSFFKRQSLPILINTSRKGNVNEIKCKQKFAEFRYRLTSTRIKQHIVNKFGFMYYHQRLLIKGFHFLISKLLLAKRQVGMSHIESRRLEHLNYMKSRNRMLNTLYSWRYDEIQRRVATIYAVSYLAQRPYRATQLAKVLGVNIRTTYRILSDLRASNWLIEDNCFYSIQPNQIQTKNP